MAAPQVLIVGCGLTGAVLSKLMSQMTVPIALTIWDKARGAGGRMTTHRFGASAVDMGAQYISKGASPNEALYSELLGAGVLQPFLGVIEDDPSAAASRPSFVAPAGTSSIVRHFAAASGASISFGKRVQRERLRRWRAAGDAGGCGSFNAVVVTVPVPQALQLTGDAAVLVGRHRRELEKVQYSSRYAMAAYYSGEAAAAATAAVSALPWSAKYVASDDCLRYVSIESRKHAGWAPPDQPPPPVAAVPNGTPAAAAAADTAALAVEGPALLLHTSVPYGLSKLEAPAAEVEADMLSSLGRQIPGLPAPTTTKLTKWRFSQVRTPLEGRPGALLLYGSSGRGGGGGGGDAFSGSAFDGCVVSA
ncbi:unnamed protein product, partial [Phaeothamnion confervicola]